MTKEQIKMKLTNILTELSSQGKEAEEYYKNHVARFDKDGRHKYAAKYGWIAAGVEIACEDLQKVLNSLDKKGGK